MKLRLHRRRDMVLFGTVIAAVVFFLALVIGRSLGLRGLTTAPPASERVEKTAPRQAAIAPGDGIRLPQARRAATVTPHAASVAETEASGGHARQAPETATAVSLAETAAADYRARAVYPPDAQPLKPGEDPILRDREVSQVRGLGAGGSGPILYVFPAEVSFEAPDTATIHAYLANDDQRIAAQDITATVAAEDGQGSTTLSFNDDGRDGDPVAGDFLYSATYTPPADDVALSTSYLVRVTAVTEDGDERRAATSFLYSNPDARLTGNYRDSVEDGHLIIEAEVDVTRAGRFHLEATLYDGAGRISIAWAQTAAELEPGRHWMRLRYWGKILRDRGIDGPYLLRFVALSTATRMPNAKNRLAEDAYRTGPHSASDFAAAAFNDQDLLGAAEQLDKDRFGGGLDVEF